MKKRNFARAATKNDTFLPRGAFFSRRAFFSRNIQPFTRCRSRKHWIKLLNLAVIAEHSWNRLVAYTLNRGKKNSRWALRPCKYRRPGIRSHNDSRALFVMSSINFWGTLYSRGPVLIFSRRWRWRLWRRRNMCRWLHNMRRCRWKWNSRRRGPVVWTLQSPVEDERPFMKSCASWRTVSGGA